MTDVSERNLRYDEVQDELEIRGVGATRSQVEGWAQDVLAEAEANLIDEIEAAAAAERERAAASVASVAMARLQRAVERGLPDGDIDD